MFSTDQAWPGPTGGSVGQVARHDRRGRLFHPIGRASLPIHIMNTFVFDIETGPLPEAELAALIPPFDPTEVKTGNLKDTEKSSDK